MYRKSFFLAIASLIILLSQIGSVLSDEILSLADRLMELESYGEAITEYKRFIFFNPKSEHISYALHKTGLAYRANHNWQEAIDAFRASISVTKDPTIADQRRIVLATTLIASGSYSLARLELLKVSEFSKQPSLRLKALYFGGVASLYMLDWDASAEAFSGFYSEYADGRMTGRAKEIESLVLNTRQSYKSARLAKFLSTILPGLGQMYAGDWRDGLNALALNGLLAGVAANAICRKHYADIAVVFSVFSRYYMGNRYHAEMGVRRYNESLNHRNAGEILRLIRADEPT